MKTILNHVAILVENIEAVLEKKQFSSKVLGEIEEFPAEGTRELYIGTEDQMGRVLLMQANGVGPYERALKKRGPGLHHIALDVINIDEFTSSLDGSGWLLHPKSLEYYKTHKQVYLSRPGIPALIEVQEKKILIEAECFIEKLDFPFMQERFLSSLNCEKLSMGSEIEMKIDGTILSVKSLLK